MTQAEHVQVLEPITEAVVEPSDPAQRLDALDGKVIGLYQNGKLNAAELMDVVEEILRGRYRLADVVRGSYNAGRVMRPEEWRDVERCDAILLTHGD